VSEFPDYSRSVGGAALAARLRRLAERFDRDSARLYAAVGVKFEQRWYGLLNQLDRNGPMAVGDLARTLRITHVSISQARHSLEAEGLVRTSSSAHDARVRQIALTRKGRRSSIGCALYGMP
jgi:DNA-binding MarR family transcriptional regulator